MMPGGRTVYLECKAAKGVMRKDQKEMKLQAMALGHEIYEVRSFKRFLEIATNPQQERRQP